MLQSFFISSLRFYDPCPVYVAATKIVIPCTKYMRSSNQALSSSTTSSRPFTTDNSFSDVTTKSSSRSRAKPLVACWARRPSNILRMSWLLNLLQSRMIGLYACTGKSTRYHASVGTSVEKQWA